jgi:hypothetical protein
MPVRRKFVLTARPGIITPMSCVVNVGDEIEFTIDKGKALVVFEPGVPPPVVFPEGPSFDPGAPLVGTAETVGHYPLSICYWYEDKGRKEHEALQMMLIVDP